MWQNLSSAAVVIGALKVIFANSADPDEMSHFIWVFTVGQSTHLGEGGGRGYTGNP